MTSYLMKHLSFDLVDNSASVCMSCDTGKKPVVINMTFPLTLSARQTEDDLRTQAKEKIRFVLTRALESLDQD